MRRPPPRSPAPRPVGDVDNAHAPLYTPDSANSRTPPRAAFPSLASVPAPGIAFGQTRVTVGYLHTLAVDGHLWTAEMNGIFAKYGIEIEPEQFNSGIPLAQALCGGSVDVAIMGAVISNFPSRGIGKVSLVNNVESGTAMIFVQGDSGIASVTDLAGRDISTTRGTTAHVPLATAPQANGLAADAAEVVNMDMAGAVSAFIGGAVPRSLPGGRSTRRSWPRFPPRAS